MGTHPARRLWAALEPLHDVVYFGDDVRAAGIALGLRGFWMTYFAFRAVPLGAVGPEPVTAMFAGFAPAMVAKALPDRRLALMNDTLATYHADGTVERRTVGDAGELAELLTGEFGIDLPEGAEAALGRVMGGGQA